MEPKDNPSQIKMASGPKPNRLRDKKFSKVFSRKRVTLNPALAISESQELPYFTGTQKHLSPAYM